MLSLSVVVGVGLAVLASLKTKTFIKEAANLCPQECPIGDDFP